jgi:hypothetical protein
MKNNDQYHEIRKARAGKMHKAMPTDVLVVPRVAEQNHARLAERPKRKRRINYAKKIMNDDFIMNL